MSDEQRLFADLGFVLVPAMLILGIVQQHTLVKKFETETELYKKRCVQAVPKGFMMAPLLRGMFYSMLLALIWLYSDTFVQRIRLYDDLGSRSEMLGYFSKADIARSILFLLLVFAFIGAALLSFLLAPA